MIDNQTKQAIVESLKLLDDNNSSVRMEAVRKLGIIGITHPQIVGRLQALASNDPSLDVRDAANQSIELLKGVSVDNKTQTDLAQAQPEVAIRVDEKTLFEILRKQNEILESFRALILNSTEAKNQKEYRLRTRIVDVDMPILSIVGFMLKWAIASIPAAFILGFVVLILTSILGGCAASIGALGN